MNDALVKYQLMEYMKMSLQRYIILFYVPTVFSFAHGDCIENVIYIYYRKLANGKQNEERK